MPLVSVVQTGAAITFPNKDNIEHDVYSFSPAKRFELNLYHGIPASPVVFDKAGLVVMGCNIHDSMIAYLLIVDTPWFAKTDASGRATIDNLPADAYRAHRVALPDERPERAADAEDQRRRRQRREAHVAVEVRIGERAMRLHSLRARIALVFVLLMLAAQAAAFVVINSVITFERAHATRERATVGRRARVQAGPAFATAKS